MQTALIAAALAVLAALGAALYHAHIVNSLTDQLQAEIGSHAVTTGKPDPLRRVFVLRDQLSLRHTWLIATQRRD